MIFLLNRAVQENPELEYNNAQRYLFNGSDLRLKAQYRKSVEEYYNTEFGDKDTAVAAIQAATEATLIIDPNLKPMVF